jgi:hypothetical protein
MLIPAINIEECIDSGNVTSAGIRKVGPYRVALGPIF